MCQAGKPKDQHKRNDNLPQFSSHHNKCLQCAGDHQTTNCTQQRQTSSTNSPASGTGTPLHQNAPSTSRTSAHTNLQSPAAHSQSTLHVQTPTLNLNAPPFPPNLHQAPLPPHAQNRTNNYHTNQRQIHTPPQILIHSFHSLSTLMSHHHTFHNTCLLTVHLLIALILQSC